MCSKSRTACLKLLFKSRVRQCLCKLLMSHERHSVTVRSHSSSQEHITLMSSAGQQELIPALGLPRGQERSQLQHFCDRDPSIILLFHLFLSLVYYLCSIQRKVFFIVCISLTALHSKAIKMPFWCMSLNTQWGGARVKGSNGFSLYFFLWNRKRNALFSLSTEETVLFHIK